MDADDEHPIDDTPDGLVQPSTSLWKQFELDVQETLVDLYAVDAQHDTRKLGNLSGRRRQIDVLVEGSIAGMDQTIVVECKRYKRTVGIGAVDAFVGKLVDLGVGAGILYSFGGFDAGARARVVNQRNPRIVLRDGSDVGSHRLIDEKFFSACDCPNPNCMGEVTWGESTDGDRMIKVGYCDSCGTSAGTCPECESVTALDHGRETCSVCSAVFEVDRGPDGSEFVVHWSRGQVD